jgi:hypothetical protein
MRPNKPRHNKHGHDWQQLHKFAAQRLLHVLTFFFDFIRMSNRFKTKAST